MRANGRSTARCRAAGAEARPRVARGSAILVLAGAVAMGGACGPKNPDGTAPGSAGTGGGTGATGAADAGVSLDANAGETIEIDGGACTAVVAQHPNEGALHVPCLPIPTYGTKPPSSGNHYMIWADYQTYATPVPWGHLVHSLEHGAIVIVYNCPGGCADEVARAQAMIDGLPFPLDPSDVDVADGLACVAPTKRRVILAPDPTLDVRWAASAWTWTLRSSCFDEATFTSFAEAHYAQGRENFCTELHEPFCDVL